ncbi:MAG: PD-(D/E)XK nuclease family protein [Leptolyngbya sp. LCM1.Bin17]|nr:MAG: PD-(D/E)XK nuclease family protein [Leptolyngbya sp. LCM1.Bin17]
MSPTPLTQGHLKKQEHCPRRVQYTYLDRLIAPADPDILQRQRWGTQFHQIMQQRDLGLAVGPLLEQDPHLKVAVEGLLTHAPELFIDPEPGLRQSEHRRSLPYDRYSLTVVYDLWIVTPQHGQIIDWKTYLKPPQQAQLAQEWQTRLYLYVLAETTDLPPDRLSMDYWFVQPQGTSLADSPPSRVAIPYSEAEHRRTDRDLRRLTQSLTHLMATAEPLPQVDEAQGLCRTCPFAVRCQRSSDRHQPPTPISLPAVADIAEVPL